MIGAHLAGVDHSYKKLKKTPAKCLVCGEYSDCQIIHYKESVHLFFITIKILNEQFWFDWDKCNHRAVLFDKSDVARYKQEQVETGILLVPYYQNMKLQKMTMPKKVPIIHIVLVLIALTILGILVAILFERLDIPFVP